MQSKTPLLHCQRWMGDLEEGEATQIIVAPTNEKMRVTMPLLFAVTRPGN